MRQFLFKIPATFASGNGDGNLSIFMLNLIAVLIYLAASAASCLAVRNAHCKDKTVYARNIFAFAACLFMILVVFRLLGAEEWVHRAFKIAFEETGRYSERRTFQVPLAVAGVIAVFVALLLSMRWLLSFSAQDRIPVIAFAASIGMVGLVFLRVVSWHNTDKLLYGGIHLNRILDPGLSLTVIACAIAYIRSREDQGTRRGGQRRR